LASFLFHQHFINIDRLSSHRGVASARYARTWYATALADKPILRRHAYQLLHAICATAVGGELLSRNPCMIEGAT
jgi:hypothetical protein